VSASLFKATAVAASRPVSAAAADARAKAVVRTVHRPASVMTNEPPSLSLRCTYGVRPVTDPDGQECQFELVLKLYSQTATNYNTV